MKKSLLALLCVFALLEAKAQNSTWLYDFGTASAAPYTSTTYSTSYLPAPQSGGGNAGVRASSSTEGSVELTTAGIAGGTGAELKMTSGTTVTGAKFGLAPFTATTVATFQCKINITSGTNGRFLLYFGNGSNFTSASGLSLPQTFAALRLSPTSTAVGLDWLSSATSPNYTTAGLSQTTINKNQSYTLKFFMNNSNSTATYITGSGATLATHSLLAGTFDIWIDNVKVLINADPGTGLLPQGTSINGMNLLNVGVGSSAPVMYIDDISYSNFLIANLPTPTITGTILNVNYENGTTNSGLTGIDVTHATAPDAAFMVPGYNSTYGIGHTVKMGDPAYESDGAQRSESSTVDAYQFFPGEERRYEVSIKMKDWPAWSSTDPLYGVVLFQLKMSDGVGEPLRVIAQRNGIESKRDVRNANGDAITTSAPLVDNFRNYVNDWIHLRIDVKWATDATGYIRIYTKLPGEQDYSLKDQSENIVTFVSQSAGNIGYLKWGVYTRAGNPGESLEGNTTLVFTAHHDNIKVFELNNTSIPIALWNNSITDNNPAYLPAPYSPSNDVLSANVVSNSISPSSDFSRSTLTPAGGATLSGRYLLGGWVTGTATTPSPFDSTQYYEFKIAPKPGYQLSLKNMSFNWRTGGTTNPNTYVLRSSLDNFTSNISAPVTVSDDAANTSNFGNSSIYDLANTSTTSEITFRMYWYGATTANTLVGIDNFTFNGNIYALESNLQIQPKNNVAKNTDNAVCTYTAQGNEFDATATGNCGDVAYSYVLSGATTASGTGSLANKVFNKGETTVIWTATDGCSNSSTSFTIKVNDIEKPIFTVPTTITVSNNENQCSATVILNQPTVTDNCAVASITNNAPALFPIGATTVTWTATDASGNTATATQTVTVNDTQAPAITAPANMNTNSNTACSATNVVLGNATVTDNCTTITVSNNAPETFLIGVTTVIWTATDASGNTATATQTVTVNDTQAPAIIAPANVNTNSNTACSATNVVLGNATATDNCTTITVSNNAPETFPIGVTTVTWTATDASGNTATATQTVTVTDVEAPKASSTTSVALCHESSGNYNIPAATANDNCSVKLVTYQVTGATTRSGNGLDASGNFKVGTSTITWAVTDNAGNSSTTATAVTINSEISASIADVYAVSPGGQANTLYLGYGPSSLTLTATPANGTAPYSYSWNNGATTFSTTVNPSTAGIHSYTAIITDALGCSFSITKQITVTDILCADGKVKICHNSSPNHDKSLCISASGVSDHLAHGCYLGNCSTLNSKNSIEIAKEETNEFRVIVAPNPTKTEFQINVTGAPVETVFVSVFDISGRRIKSLKAKSGQTINVGNDLNSGMYFAEITQGENKKTVKLIKQ